MVEDETLWSEDYQLEALSLVGTTLADRYELKRLVGQGGMGSVYLATDELLDREVAVKLMRAGILGTQNTRRFYREARTLARMNHPNIVTLYNCGWHSNQPYLVMEYAAGTCLNTILAKSNEATDVKNKLTINEAMDIAIKIARALAYAHTNGVIHLDIKPGNIIIGDETKLMDFGIAQIRQASSPAIFAEVTGTPLYMAPEQSLGKAVDERADLYSFSLVLYEMFTGRPPFLASDEMSRTSHHIQVTPVAPSLRNPGVPKRLDSLILKMLSKDPNKRPASAKEVLVELEAARLELPEMASSEIPKIKKLAPGDQTKVDALRGVPLFAPISTDDLCDLSQKLTERRFHKGQIVFHKDSFGSTLHIIKTGRVKISIPKEDTEDVILAYLRPFDFFGEMALVDEKPRSARATATELTETLALERGDFLDFLKWYPDATIRILSVLTQRLRNLNAHLENVIFTNPPARLAETLVNLMNLHGSERPDGYEISVPITIAELAGMSGVNFGETRKLLQAFRASEIISAKNRRYVIRKPEELRKIANSRQIRAL